MRFHKPGAHAGAMKSMTGFGRGTALLDGLEISIEMTSVNRRNLETFFNLPKEWQALERTLTERLREVLQRGRIQVSIQVGSANRAEGLHWDEEAVLATVDKIRPLAYKLEVKWPPDAETLLKIILLHRSDATLPAPDEAEPAVLAALDQALHALEAMRAEEGEALQGDLRSRVATLTNLLEQVVAQGPLTVQNYREMLLQRLRQAKLEIDLSDERVLKEVAIFADRMDTSEEITRLRSHLDQFARTLEPSAGEAVGRKLEFLVQEINREFNTIGSKANNLEVTKAVIEAKNELERIREQIQNVE